MSEYQAILNKASELYNMLDALAEERNAQHREAEAISLYNAKISIQKLLGVPPKIAAQPIVTEIRVPDIIPDRIPTENQTVFGLPVVETLAAIVPPDGEIVLGPKEDLGKPASRGKRK